jgi:GT2 family glycosyltransferase
MGSRGSVVADATSAERVSKTERSMVLGAGEMSAARLSVVIPVFNKIEYTRSCLESFFRTNHAPTVYIVVNNGSTDGTREYLETLPVTVIDNATNRGYAPAVNQGIRAARTPYVLLANNDIVVTTGCVSRLMEFMTRHGHDLVSPAIRTGPLRYDVEAYARAFTAACAAAVRPEVDASCVLVRSSVFDTVGVLDERFMIGGFEDTDFFWRCRQAGCSMAMTGSAFIHHVAMVTQNAIKSELAYDYGPLNERRFTEKWGRTAFGGWWERRRNRLARYLRRTTEQLRYGYTLMSKEPE